MNRKCEALYLRPWPNYQPGLWYQDMPIGVNKLCGFVKEITSKAGIDGFFTNYSLYSTAATHLYQGGVEEQVITEITGHRSLAMRGYKRTHEAQKCKALQILQGELNKCAYVDNWKQWLEQNAMTVIMQNNLLWTLLHLSVVKNNLLAREMLVVLLLADISQQDQRKVHLFRGVTKWEQANSKAVSMFLFQKFNCRNWHRYVSGRQFIVCVT